LSELIGCAFSVNSLPTVRLASEKKHYHSSGIVALRRAFAMD
jgi:hypothetical protein